MVDLFVIAMLGILSFIISSLIHELGHMLVGLFNGFKLYLLIFGPFGIKRNRQDKLILYIEKNILLWGGLCATVPVSDDEDNYKKFGYILLGGPITSIIFGLVFLPIGIIYVNLFFLLLGAMPISMGIATIIPSRSGAFYSDGGRWLRLHNNETKDIEIAIWNITQKISVMGNYKDVRLDEIKTLIDCNDLKTNYIGYYYAFNYYKFHNDNQNMSDIKTRVDLLINKIPNQLIKMFPIQTVD